MTKEEVTDKFRAFLTARLPADEAAFSLAEPFMEVVHVRKGELFVQRDKVTRRFAFIASGIMRAFSFNDGEEKTSCICTENAFANSTVSFITQTPSEVNIQALTDVVLLTIHYDHLQQLYQQSPWWLHVGRIIMEQEFLSLQQKTVRFAQLPPDDKYLSLLKENPEVIREVPLKHIASFLNITPETLSRIRKRTGRVS